MTAPAIAVLTPDQVQALASDAYSAGYLRAQSELETALLTTADVAKRLGYASTAPVLDRIRRGELIALKIGDEWRCRPSAVRDFIDRCEKLTAGSEGPSPMTPTLSLAPPVTQVTPAASPVPRQGSRGNRSAGRGRTARSLEVVR